MQIKMAITQEYYLLYFKTHAHDYRNAISHITLRFSAINIAWRHASWPRFHFALKQHLMGAYRPKTIMPGLRFPSSQPSKAFDSYYIIALRRTCSIDDTAPEATSITQEADFDRKSPSGAEYLRDIVISAPNLIGASMRDRRAAESRDADISRARLNTYTSQQCINAGEIPPFPQLLRDFFEKRAAEDGSPENYHATLVIFRRSMTSKEKRDMPHIFGSSIDFHSSFSAHALCTPHFMRRSSFLSHFSRHERQCQCYRTSLR